MLIETPKRLPEDLDMICYACEDAPATHLCRYKVGELVIQVCLCPICMKIDTMRLLENTIGIQGLSSHYTPSDGSGGLEDSDSEREAPDNHHHRSSWTVQL